MTRVLSGYNIMGTSLLISLLAVIWDAANMHHICGVLARLSSLGPACFRKLFFHMWVSPWQLQIPIFFKILPAAGKRGTIFMITSWSGHGQILLHSPTQCHSSLHHLCCVPTDAMKVSLGHKCMTGDAQCMVDKHWASACQTQAAHEVLCGSQTTRYAKLCYAGT